ncbi:MAG: hypothetical protein AB7F19_06445 [Candidatus Babeliales bacterium]
MVKSFWKTRAAEEYKNTNFLERVQEDCKQSGQFINGAITTCVDWQS